MAALALASPRQGEFSASGQGVLRVESEFKLTVPEDLVEPLWIWLNERYTDRSWMGARAETLRVTLGDEHFRDTYFDNSDFDVLRRSGGVRHRERRVHSGSAAAKDGRQLLQVKIASEDSSGVNRGEIKFAVDPPSRAREPEDRHPLLGLLPRRERPAVERKFAEVGLSASELRPMLVLEQTRRRLYLSDNGGALATLTLDQCTASEYGVDLHWTELELELNEIRYTEATPTAREEFDAFLVMIEQDVLQHFPRIRRDQTPKYVKLFRGVEAESLLPLRTMLRLGVGWGDFLAVLALLATLLGGGLALGLRRFIGHA